MVQRLILSRSLSAAAQKSYSKSIATADAEWDERIKQLQGVVQHPSAYAAVYDICYTDHNDAGWSVESYNYKCYVAYVSFFGVNGGDGFSKPSGSLSDGVYQPLVHDTYSSAAEESTYPSESAYVSNVNLYITSEGIASDARVATDMKLLAQNVVAYAAQDAYENRKLVREAGDRVLDPQKTYVVLTTQRPYFYQDIGCAIGRSVFCSSPLGE